MPMSAGIGTVGWHGGEHVRGLVITRCRPMEHIQASVRSESVERRPLGSHPRSSGRRAARVSTLPGQHSSAADADGPSRRVVPSRRLAPMTSITRRPLARRPASCGRSLIDAAGPSALRGGRSDQAPAQGLVTFLGVPCPHCQRVQSVRCDHRSLRTGARGPSTRSPPDRPGLTPATVIRAWRADAAPPTQRRP